jgi:chromosome segregation ATPase
MDSTCSAKTAEWEKITQARAEEKVAIAETIKVLNDDDALEIFKKTLPSTSFVQEIANSINLKHKALGMVQELRLKSPQQMNRIPLDLISVALSGKKVNFEKVLKLIDSMVVILGQEQEDDNSKQEYCEKQFDFSGDKKQGLLKDLKDLEATMADNSETIGTLTDEIKALSKGIADLDKVVAESTENRKDEHQEHLEFMSSDAAAKKLLEYAKNRLNQYYNPTLYKPPSGGAALVEISVHRADKKDAPEAAPESFKAYKKSDDGKGVIDMLERIAGDLDKEMTEAESTEKDAQKEYEAFMTDAAEKRADDSKQLTDNEGYKADAETQLQTAKEGNMAKVKELMATDKYISGLHAECDFLITNFEVRKEARAGEIEALKNAKAILNGADLSLLQQSGIAHSLRGSA